MIAVYLTFLVFVSRWLHCATVYTISSSEPLFPNQTLVSPSQIFELGFFVPNGSSSQYVGIWYKNFTPTKHVWVANRDHPLRYDDRLASLTIGSYGNLGLLDGDRNTVWSTNVSTKSNGSTAVLLDTGNLVLRDAGSGNSIWESFDHPTDTLLPGMKIGVNVKTGEIWNLVSWKTYTDPSPGMFSVGMTPEVPTQPFLWNGTAPYWRGGQWDKSKFIGIYDMDSGYLSGYNVQQDILQGTTYFSYSTPDSVLGYMFISPEGSFWSVEEESGGWAGFWEAPADRCEVYGTCGSFGVCSTGSTGPVCKCLEGFGPRSEEEWRRGNWTGGCIRKNELRCQKVLSAGGSSTLGTKTDYFVKLSQLKLPDKSAYLQDVYDADAGCENWCLANCSCTAYSYIDNIGCMVWSDELLDIQNFNGSGKDLFLRLAHSEREERTTIIVSLATISCVVVVVVLGASMYAICRRRANTTGGLTNKLMLKFSRITDAPVRDGLIGKSGLKEDVSSELPMFDLKTISLATSNFCIRNKLGQGGFGPVYKGTLQEGKEVAVKRLSSSSGQGVEEFKNEILLISKLQHRNLVKLLGCCIEGEEKILVYEYLSNESLDTFLFDPRRKSELTWEKRFEIILGISRGLLYLHRDSCLRVIHRDLKASNILLDEKMTPKISDFGLARIFQATQDLVNTRRVVGTLGYMSPEYAIGGMFSEKSDVYSFGVLMLEIISGRRSTSLCYLGETLNLLSYAWELWREGREMELLDEAISADSIDSMAEVTKCIQIGLLCIQDHATDRPNVVSVVLMLSGDSDLPNPRAPTLTTFRSTSINEIRSQQEGPLSINAVTCTMDEGR